jgi:hypothetical protein
VWSTNTFAMGTASSSGTSGALSSDEIDQRVGTLAPRIIVFQLLQVYLSTSLGEFAKCSRLSALRRRRRLERAGWLPRTTSGELPQLLALIRASLRSRSDGEGDDANLASQFHRHSSQGRDHPE